MISFNNNYEPFLEKLQIIELIKKEYDISYFLNEFIERRIQSGINYFKQIIKFKINFDMDELNSVGKFFITGEVKSSTSDNIYKVKSNLYNNSLENRLFNINKCDCIDGKNF
jgi:ribosome-associated translation inhibitor RaiA